MPPWPFFSAARSGSPRAATTPEVIDDGLHTFPGERLAFVYDSDVDLDLDELQLPAPPFAASNSPKSRTGHTRSLSGNLPSIFGGRKRAPSHPSTPDPPPASTSQFHDGAASPRPKTAKPTFGEEIPETGSCATCASKVKWPAGVKEFRCGTCLMINDLKPPQKRPPSPNVQGQAFARAGTYPGNGPDRRGLPLSIDRTKAIIDRCIDDFLLERQKLTGSRNITPVTSPPVPSHIPSLPIAKDGHNTLGTAIGKTPALATRPKTSATSSLVVSHGLDNPSSDTQSVSLDNLRNAQARLIRNGPTERANTRGSSVRGRRGLPAQPTRRPPPPPMQPFSPPPNAIPRKPLPQSPEPVSPTNYEARLAHQSPGAREDPTRLAKHIFKPLEDYIVNNFGVHDAMNRSFSSNRPRVRPPARSEDNLRSREPPLDRSTTFAFDGYDSQIDAKTLLLGNVAENGLWWAGKEECEDDPNLLTNRGPFDVSTEQLVHPKSPHINWLTVQEWYRLVIRCGEDWRTRLKHPALEGRLDYEGTLKQAQAIEHAFLEGRVHVHKTLLKASESLLKRPGRPLTVLSDIRFLLILLENPLLYPTRSAAVSPPMPGESRSMTGTGFEDHDSGMDHAPQRRNEPASSYWEQGQTFGIIKRSLGLMSNLPNEIHRSLQSWFTRYDEGRFRSLVALIQSFVTHRLNRQRSNKRKDKPKCGNLIPQLSGTGTESSAQLHAALGLSSPSKNPTDSQNESAPYSEDWQIKAAARMMAILFAANKTFRGERTATRNESQEPSVTISRHSIKHHGYLLSMSEFYNLKADLCDLTADFETWELSKTKFSFCQFPFFLSVGSKIRILEHDAQRQMSLKAREAFFNSILHNKDLKQYLHLKVRRDCLVEDSLTALSQTVAQGEAEIKKGLRVHFVGEEGIDAGGLRKEWFLLLIREIFDPEHGMFVYDDESHLCYFNPHTFEASEQYFLVGALLGLAIHNLTILDIALPPFLFRKLLTSGQSSGQQNAYNRLPMRYTLDELSELRPNLARGLRQLLEFDGNVQETYCRDFVADVERYGSTELIPLCTNGVNRQVTNSNRQEFVELYVRFLLDTHITRQFEPFKRGFFTVCRGNALSLFQPEEIELLIRGSDEPLDVPSLKAVAVYENWRRGSRKVDNPAEDVDLIRWFWEFLEAADPKAQRKVLSFITGSDRIPAMGATSLVIKIAFAGNDYNRFPIARTCFNLLLLYKYRTKKELVDRLWRAVTESEGFGLK